MVVVVVPIFSPCFFLPTLYNLNLSASLYQGGVFVQRQKKRRCTLVHLLFEELDRESHQLIIRGKQLQETSASNGLCAAVHVQFVEDVTCMLLYGAQGDDEFTRDGLI